MRNGCGKHHARGCGQQQPLHWFAMAHNWLGCLSHSRPLRLALIDWEKQRRLHYGNWISISDVSICLSVCDSCSEFSLHTFLSVLPVKSAGTVRTGGLRGLKLRPGNNHGSDANSAKASRHGRLRSHRRKSSPHRVSGPTAAGVHRTIPAQRRLHSVAPERAGAR